MQIGWGMPSSWSAEMDWGGGGGEMDSRLLTSCSLHPSPFIGATAAYGVPKRSLEEFGEYYYEGGCIEKKRRLTVEQVRLLESSFERENKLEPEKKLQLAQKLGLEPRQVSVWFQNRRARSKSKRLELSFDSLKANYDSVSAEVDKLRFEVAHLNALLRAKNENESVATAAKPLVITTAALERGDEDEDKEDESSFAPIPTVDVAGIKQDSPPLGGGTATSDYSGSDNSQWLPRRPVFLEEEEEEECLHHHHNNTSPSDVTDCVAAATAVYDAASSPDTRTGDENRLCCIDSYADYADAAALAQQQDSFSAFFPNESWLW